jgi:hypothetical protein
VTADAAHPPRLTVFGPHPLLTVTIERRGGADDVHLHARRHRANHEPRLRESPDGTAAGGA